ncbi:MAG: serine acetyltransferase [Colwellia sp.]|nr:serine acetyltransferase [Colwellia sp.]
MIKNKKDLEFYLAADKFALGIKHNRPRIQDVIWKYQIYLRKSEYYRNQDRRLINRVMSALYKYKKLKLGLLLGFDIGDNVFGAGLKINHFGNLVVSAEARIGMWCDIHQGVNVGTSNSVDGNILTPTIGNNVWIGPGAKIYGDIQISNRSVIGANSVVNKSFTENVTLAGVPAVVIKQSGTQDIDVAASPKRVETFLRKFPEYKKRI